MDLERKEVEKSALILVVFFFYSFCNYDLLLIFLTPNGDLITMEAFRFDAVFLLGFLFRDLSIGFSACNVSPTFFFGL